MSANALGRDGIHGWHEATRFAAHATPYLRDALVDRAVGVLADDPHDEIAVVTALVVIAQIAANVPAALLPPRATARYDEIAGLAEGQSSDGAPPDPQLDL